MDIVDPSATTPAAEQPVTATGVGYTFRAIAEGTSAERRRRSPGATARAGRALTAPEASAADSGTWRLAL